MTKSSAEGIAIVSYSRFYSQQQRTMLLYIHTYVHTWRHRSDDRTSSLIGWGINACWFLIGYSQGFGTMTVTLTCTWSIARRFMIVITTVFSALTVPTRKALHLSI